MKRNGLPIGGGIGGSTVGVGVGLGCVPVSFCPEIGPTTKEIRRAHLKSGINLA